MSQQSGPAFELKGTAATLTVLRLRTNDVERIGAELRPRVAQLPHFFEHAPVVLDVGGLDEGLDLFFDALLGELRRSKLVPVAIRNAEGKRLEAALDAGLGQLKGGGGRALRQPTAADGAKGKDKGKKKGKDKQPPAPPPVPAEAGQAPAGQAPAPEPAPLEPVAVEPPAPSLTVKSPVRGGQVVYAQGTDLVLLAPVNPGGEVIADGNIHAYAPIRGRALAGAHGNDDARIFCQSLDAELVSVAGHYLSADEIGETWRKKPAQVRLEAGTLVISDL